MKTRMKNTYLKRVKTVCKTHLPGRQKIAAVNTGAHIRSLEMVQNRAVGNRQSYEENTITVQIAPSVIFRNQVVSPQDPWRERTYQC